MCTDISNISSKYLAYFPDFSPNALQKLLVERAKRNNIPVIRLFLTHYKAFPCLLKCTKPETNALFHVSSILNYLKNNFQHNPINDIILQRYDTKTKQYYASSRVCNVENGIMIYIQRAYFVSDIENSNEYNPDFSDDYFLVTAAISIYYLPEYDINVQNLAKEFLKLSLFQTRTLQFNMICYNQASGFYLTPIKIKKPIIYDLALYYGENFINIHKKILNQLNKKDGNGIVLLHGIPGSGKTHYIRYLIEEIENKTLIYIPPDMAKNISKPEFLTFLLTKPNSVLIIEDAENIIRDRNEITFNSTQAVANLLNLSDGLLGDAIHMQIIATFNCDLTTIDKALLRKGRLIAHYNFEKLNINNAKILSEKLGFGVEHISQPMTLAEIYNQNKENETDIIV